jgi:hypothetical protein
MRDQLGVVLIENLKGDVSVELFSNPDAIQPTIDEMVGKPGDEPTRLTFLKLYYKDGVFTTEAITRDLPFVNPVPKPDGFLVGEGPIMFKKEESV